MRRILIVSLLLAATSGCGGLSRVAAAAALEPLPPHQR
jgi:hypothetical protein